MSSRQSLLELAIQALGCVAAVSLRSFGGKIDNSGKRSTYSVIIMNHLRSHRYDETGSQLSSDDNDVHNHLTELRV